MKQSLYPSLCKLALQNNI